MGASRIRVLIAEGHLLTGDDCPPAGDGHPLVFADIRATLEPHGDIEVVGEARCAPQLISLIERRAPEIVLMDVRRPGVGAGPIRGIRERWPEVKIVVLSACDRRSTIHGALQAGANAYAVKTADGVDIASLLRHVSSGLVFLAPSEGSEPHAGAGDRSQSPGLTDRELSILAAVASGMTTAAISRKLWISEHTVKFHLTNIYRKLGVSNRAGAVRYAIQHGLAAVQ